MTRFLDRPRRAIASACFAFAIHVAIAAALCTIRVRPIAVEPVPDETVVALEEDAPVLREEPPAAPGAIVPSTVSAKPASNPSFAPSRLDVLSLSPSDEPVVTTTDDAAPFALGPITTGAGPGSGARWRPGDANPFAGGRAEAAPSAAEAPPRSDRFLGPGLQARDIAAGMGPDGPAIRALRDATYASFAPVEARAVFLARVNENGETVDLRISEAEGDRMGWEDARRRAAAALAAGLKATLRGCRGALLEIEVISTMTKVAEGTVGTIAAIATLNVDQIGQKSHRVVQVRRVSVTPL